MKITRPLQNVKKASSQLKAAELAQIAKQANFVQKVQASLKSAPLGPILWLKAKLAQTASLDLLVQARRKKGRNVKKVTGRKLKLLSALLVPVEVAAQLKER